MSAMNMTGNTGITTLVGFHDLLGYGDMVAASSGTLESAVGEIAYKRILGLQRSVAGVRDCFPDGTRFFHMNDTVTAYLDVAINIVWGHTDPSGIGIAGFTARTEYLKVLHFVSGCATLHQRSIQREERERLGPAGRTFVVMGKRWALDQSATENVLNIPELQANLAFAEAYLADSAGSRGGFNQRSHDRLYINDYVHMILQIAAASPVTLPEPPEPSGPGAKEWAEALRELKRQQQLPLTDEERNSLNQLGIRRSRFPNNIFVPDTSPINIEIFHRKRTFYSLMAHHAWDIGRALALTKVSPP
jgi:hypothetical protein